MDLILFVLSSIGFTNIVVESDISMWAGQKARCLLTKLQNFASNYWSGFTTWHLDWLWHGLECKQCVGFWTGLFTGAVLISGSPWVVLTCGFASSMLATFYDLIVGYILTHSTFDVGGTNEQ